MYLPPHAGDVAQITTGYAVRWNCAAGSVRMLGTESQGFLRRLGKLGALGIEQLPVWTVTMSTEEVVCAFV